MQFNIVKTFSICDRQKSVGGGGEGFPGKLLQTGSKLFRLLKFPNAVLETVSISRVIAFFIHVYFERALRFLKVTDILQPLNLTFNEILSLFLLDFLH